MSVDLHTTVTGPSEAPPLLLGGSLGSTAQMWQPQAEELSTHFRVVRFDLRGHGLSPVPEGPYTMADLGEDVLALMDRLGIARAHYAGISLGGMIGQWLALNAPDRIDRLALLATSPYPGPPQNWLDRAALAREKGPGALADAVVGRWFTEGYARAHADEVEELRDGIADTPAEGYASCCEAISRWDVREELPHVTVPTLVIGGAQDEATPVQGNTDLIAERIPGAQLVVLDHAAHLLSWQQAPRVNTLLARHMAPEDGGRDPRP
ncbi:3-oxoadipate enol-lactonase [Nocardiopsis kunsanensis]|uniref:3-oxoadipate enol-lactonase n=1 Tax=Nocardiopsis kunsanensis TaxID=141693 RepID=UPI00034DDFDF|nr:3-oxoadipate enol-lactonase [Nocardiopsis kunsanensis]